MQARLSANSIKALEPEAKAYEVVDTEIKGFLLRVQPTGRKTFYFSYRTTAGVRKRIKIGVMGATLTLTQARDQASIYSGKASAGEDIQGDKAAGRSKAKAQLKHTLSVFMNTIYKSWAVANLKSGQQTVDSVTRSFPDLLNLPMAEIGVKHIERWRTEKLMAGLKATTINRVVNALRGVLTKALEWEVLEEHPLAKLKALKIDEGTKARYLSEAEESRLYAALLARDTEQKAARSRGNQFRDDRGYALLPDLSKHDYSDRMTPLIILSLKTGMRRGELFDLKWDAVDFKNKIITVEGTTAKSNKTRHIRLSPTAYKAITSWKAQSESVSGRVFPSDEGNRLNNVKRSWESILKSAEIERFRWHDMRHDFASKLVMRGVPLNTVRELCGHADLSTTLRYAHLAQDHKADAVDSLG